jgi:hypothetical protein
VLEGICGLLPVPANNEGGTLSMIEGLDHIALAATSHPEAAAAHRLGRHASGSSFQVANVRLDLHAGAAAACGLSGLAFLVGDAVKVCCWFAAFPVSVMR